MLSHAFSENEKYTYIGNKHESAKIEKLFGARIIMLLSYHTTHLVSVMNSSIEQVEEEDKEEQERVDVDNQQKEEEKERQEITNLK